jgi:UDP-N-acetylglucosamine/UDP-N-acetyl-alpha-D-glucosaminouronate 4-epimerase
VDVLVTGGAGFIGSNLVRYLVAAGAVVRVLDDLSTGSSDNLDHLQDRMEFLVGDVRDLRMVRRAVDGVDVVFHLAALPTVARSMKDPVETDSVNAGGTLNVLVAARELGVRRLIYASSSSVYGNNRALPKREEMATDPRSPYAASKLAGEAHCQAFTRTYGLETVSLRFFNVFGPRQDPASDYAAVIPSFAGRMLAGVPPVIFGDGKQSRDFTFVDNAVDACLLAARADRRSAGEVVNIGCDERVSLLELVGVLNMLLGTKIDPVFDAARPGDIRHSLAAIGKARRLLGYRPRVLIREGLARTIAWLASKDLRGSGGRSSAEPRIDLTNDPTLHATSMKE